MGADSFVWYARMQSTCMQEIMVSHRGITDPFCKHVMMITVNGFTEPGTIV